MKYRNTVEKPSDEMRLNAASLAVKKCFDQIIEAARGDRGTPKSHLEYLIRESELMSELVTCLDEIDGPDWLRKLVCDAVALADTRIDFHLVRHQERYPSNEMVEFVELIVDKGANEIQKEWWNIHEVAEHLGIGVNSARKQLSRWEIKGERHYPAGIVVARQTARTRWRTTCPGCGLPGPSDDFCDSCIEAGAATEIPQDVDI